VSITACAVRCKGRMSKSVKTKHADIRTKKEIIRKWKKIFFAAFDDDSRIIVLKT
jgi:hypothetical protein